MSGPEPPSLPSAKPKLPAAERKSRQADRLTTIRLRMAIWRVLDDQGISSPAEVGAALGLPAAAATGLLARHQWRDGDVALLRAVAARLGLRCRIPAEPRAGGRRRGREGGRQLLTCHN